MRQIPFLRMSGVCVVNEDGDRPCDMNRVPCQLFLNAATSPSLERVMLLELQNSYALLNIGHPTTTWSPNLKFLDVPTKGGVPEVVWGCKSVN